MSDKSFDLVTQPHYFRTEGRQHREVPVGATIADLVALSGFPGEHHKDLEVVISKGVESTTVPQDCWARVRPREGSHVLIYPAVHGPVVGVILSAVLPNVAATLAGTLFAAGTLGFKIAVAAITIVGSLLINALIPPPAVPETVTDDDPIFSITGSSNAENRYGIYPVVLGRHLIYPPKTARGYTEGEEDIYFRGRFTFGYGPVALETLRIGTTPITEFEDVELEFLNVDRARTLAHMPELAPMVRAWRQGAERMTLYPDDIAEDSYSVKLTKDVSVVRVTRDRATTAVVFVTYNQGLVQFDGSNRKLDRSVRLTFRYRKIGDPAWTDAGRRTHTAKTTASIRYQKTIRFPEEGEYEIEVTRVTEESDETTIRDDVYLSSIRSVQAGELPSHPEIAEVAVRIKASDQLNGQLDTLNGIAQQLAPVWNGSSWSAPEPVRHPAWIYARSLMGPMAKSPVAASRLQLDDLLAWYQEEPHWTCDLVVDQPAQMGEILDIICATGRARRTLRDLKYSVIRDGGAGPVIQQFTPRNSWDFSGEIVFPKEIHGFLVRFISERLDWQQDELVVYADGYNAGNATELETLDLRGVVLTKDEADGGTAWRLGRYHLAQLILRPEVFAWKSDLDHLRVNMGDKVRLVHDVPKIGVGAGRLKSFSLTPEGFLDELTLDEFMAPTGLSFRLSIRRADGTELIFTAQPPLSFAGLWRVEGDIDPAGIAVGDLVAVEEMIQESMEVLVTSILHEGDLRATLRGVPAAPEVLQADQGTIPPYNPIITNVYPNDKLLPLPPRIVSAVAQNQIWDNKEGGRSIAVFAELEWRPGAAFSAEEFLVYMTMPDGTRSLAETTRATQGRYYLPLIGRYRFEIIARNAAGVSEPAVDEVQRTVLAETPRNVSGFVTNVTGDQMVLAWNQGEAIVSHYHLRYLSPNASGGWAQSTLINDQILGNQIILPARKGTYLIKAVSLFGRESGEEAVLLVESAGLSDLNVVETLVEHPEFAGALTPGLSRHNGGLLLASNTPIASWTTLAAVKRISTFGGVEPLGIYSFAQTVDLGEVYSSRVSADVRGFGFRPDNTLASWATLAEVETLSGVGTDAWEIRMEISTTTDDPGAPGAVWSDYAPLRVGDYVARALRFQIVLESRSPSVVVQVDHADVTVDMPDRVEGDDNVDCPPGGVFVPFVPPFRDVPAIGVDGQELPSGARSIRTGVTRAGFHQRFVDVSDAPIAASFDWLAKGYGRAL